MLPSAFSFIQDLSVAIEERGTTTFSRFPPPNAVSLHSELLHILAETLEKPSHFVQVRLTRAPPPARINICPPDHVGVLRLYALRLASSRPHPTAAPSRSVPPRLPV